jgi:aspartyl-tRNA(Asn)/glutamyl-tRNA(Gln) amidotransferase subunit C
MSGITKAEVLEIAVLARLRLSDDEAERLRAELAQILGYVEKLRAVDTEGVEPMTHAVPMDCPLRPDTPAPSLSADEALADGPQRIDDFFGVPRIIEVDR